MIAVTFALPAESSAFIRLLKGVKRDGALLFGNIERRTPNVEQPTLQLGILHTGVGKMKCAERVENFRPITFVFPHTRMNTPGNIEFTPRGRVAHQSLFHRFALVIGQFAVEIIEQVIRIHDGED